MNDVNEDINRLVDRLSDDMRKKLLVYVSKRVMQAYKDGLKEGSKAVKSSHRDEKVESPPRQKGRPSSSKSDKKKHRSESDDSDSD